jgi:hypothetical protein
VGRPAGRSAADGLSTASYEVERRTAAPANFFRASKWRRIGAQGEHHHVQSEGDRNRLRRHSLFGKLLF